MLNQFLGAPTLGRALTMWWESPMIWYAEDTILFLSLNGGGIGEIDEIRAAEQEG